MGLGLIRLWRRIDWYYYVIGCVRSYDNFLMSYFNFLSDQCITNVNTNLLNACYFFYLIRDSVAKIYLCIFHKFSIYSNFKI